MIYNAKMFKNLLTGVTQNVKHIEWLILDVGWFWGWFHFKGVILYVFVFLEILFLHAKEHIDIPYCVNLGIVTSTVNDPSFLF